LFCSFERIINYQPRADVVKQKKYRIAGLGEVLWDIFPEEKKIPLELFNLFAKSIMFCGLSL